MALTCDESFCAARTKYSDRIEVRDGLVAENEIMGTWALSPRLIKKLACIEDSGPMMACTSTFFIRSRAVIRKGGKFWRKQNV